MQEPVLRRLYWDSEFKPDINSLIKKCGRTTSSIGGLNYAPTCFVSRLLGLWGIGVQVVSEWLVSNAGAFFSLLAPEGKERSGFTACVFALHYSITLFKRKVRITKKPCRKTRTVRTAGQTFSAVTKSKLDVMPRKCHMQYGTVMFIKTKSRKL